MAGIQNVKETLDFALSLTTAIDQAAADGFTTLDLVAIIPAFVKLPDAVDDINQVISELEDLDVTEQAELDEFIKKFDLRSDKAEEIVEQSLFLAIELMRLILLIREKPAPAPTV